MGGLGHPNSVGSWSRSSQRLPASVRVAARGDVGAVEAGAGPRRPGISYSSMCRRTANTPKVRVSADETEDHDPPDVQIWKAHEVGEERADKAGR